MLWISDISICIFRDSSLDSFVHCGAFQSLLWNLALASQSLISKLLLLLVCILAWNHHLSLWCLSTVLMLLLTAHIKVLVPRTCIVWTLIWRRLVRLGIRFTNVVLLTEVFDLGQDTKSTLGRNETWYDFLSNILCTCSKKIFKLDWTELLDDSALLAYTLMETFFKLIQLSFFFVKILDESSSSLLHLMESTF